jgi:hypothetical protein
LFDRGLTASCLAPPRPVWVVSGTCMQLITQATPATHAQAGCACGKRKKPTSSSSTDLRRAAVAQTSSSRRAAVAHISAHVGASRFRASQALSGLPSALGVIW